MEDDAWVDVTPEGLMRELTSVTATLPLEDKSFQKAVVSAIKAIQTEDAGDDPTLTGKPDICLPSRFPIVVPVLISVNLPSS